MEALRRTNIMYYFYAPEIEDLGAYCFGPVCNSVWNFNLADNM